MSYYSGKLSEIDSGIGSVDAGTDGNASRLTQVAQALRDDAHAIQAALSLAERRFQATFVHAPVGIAHVGLDGAFLMVNPRFEAITGYAADVLMRIGFQQITHADDLDIDVALLARLNASELQRYTLEKRYIRGDGSVVWVNLTVAMVRDDTGAPEFYVAVVEDMSDIRQAHYDALHDPLTGLPNRRGFAADAARVLDRAARDRQSVSLLYLDLDGFKRLNDRFGHQAGDRCLADVARLLETAMRPGDAAARMGGDEFVLLLAGRTGDDAMEAGRRLKDGLATLGRDGQHVGGSFGLVTLIPDSPAVLDGMIARADAAMLAAKRSGRNQILAASGG